MATAALRHHRRDVVRVARGRAGAGRRDDVGAIGIREARVADEPRIGHAGQKGDHVRLFRSGHIDRFDQGIAMRALASVAGVGARGDEPAAVRVVLQDVVEGRGATVVKVGARDRDVAQRRDLELAHVIREGGELVEAGVVWRVAAHAVDVVEAVVAKVPRRRLRRVGRVERRGKGGSGVAVVAVELLGVEQRQTVLRRGAHRALVAGLILIIGRAAGDHRPLERGEGLDDVSHAEEIDVAGERRLEQSNVGWIGAQPRQDGVRVDARAHFDRQVGKHGHQRLLLECAQQRVRPHVQRFVANVGERHRVAHQHLAGGADGSDISIRERVPLVMTARARIGLVRRESPFVEQGSSQLYLLSGHWILARHHRGRKIRRQIEFVGMALGWVAAQQHYAQGEMKGRHRSGGLLRNLSCSDRRCMFSRLAASEMFPPQSESTRCRCSHSTRASDGTGHSSAFTSPRARG